MAAVTICSDSGAPKKSYLSQQEFVVWLRKLKQGLCINLEGWYAREFQKGGDMFKIVAVGAGIILHTLGYVKLLCNEGGEIRIVQCIVCTQSLRYLEMLHGKLKRALLF